MNRTLHVIGASHKSAPVEERERLAVAGSDVGDSVRRLLSVPNVDEAVVLSTCNRVEFYAAGPREVVLTSARAYLAEYCGVDDTWLRKNTYAYAHRDALGHLFRVTSSLDSLVVGEPQIMGQAKDAFALAQEVGGTGALMSRAFHHAFHAAKRVRTETGIAENAVSISYAAVELAKKVFGTLDGKTVLVIGAGQMGELALKNLLAAGVGRVRVANRSRERAMEAAVACGGSGHGLDELPKLLEEVDIVISSTGSQNFIVRLDAVKAALAERKYRPLFLIDIAVPRDIDPRCDALQNVYLFDVDDLEKVVDANMQTRRAEASRAEVMVREEVDAMLEWMRQGEVVPTIVSLRQKLNTLKDDELERMLRDNPDLTPEAREAAERMARSLINKVLHEPTVSLRKATNTGHHGALVSAVRSLFDLAEDTPSSGIAAATVKEKL